MSNNGKLIEKGSENIFVRIYRELPLAYITIGVFILSSILVPRFFTPINLMNLVLQSADIIVIACGLTFVILNGSIVFGNMLLKYFTMSMAT